MLLVVIGLHSPARLKCRWMASLRDVSKSSSSGLPLHSHVCSVYSIFGVLIEFFRRMRALCECRRDSLLQALFRLPIFFLSALSMACPLRTRARRSVISLYNYSFELITYLVAWGSFDVLRNYFTFCWRPVSSAAKNYFLDVRGHCGDVIRGCDVKDETRS